MVPYVEVHWRVCVGCGGVKVETLTKQQGWCHRGDDLWKPDAAAVAAVDTCRVSKLAVRCYARWCKECW